VLADRVRLGACAIHSLSRRCCFWQVVAAFHANQMSCRETAESSSHKLRRRSLVSPITLAEPTCTDSIAAASRCMRTSRPVSKFLVRPMRSAARLGPFPWTRYRLVTWSFSGSTAGMLTMWGFIQVPVVLFTRRVPDRPSHTEVSTILITISTSPEPAVSGAKPWREPRFCRRIETYSLKTRTKIMC